MSQEPMLDKLVEQYGAEQVWRVGIDVLGYPPSWMPSMSEVHKIQDALRRTD